MRPTDEISGRRRVLEARYRSEILKLDQLPLKIIFGIEGAI